MSWFDEAKARCDFRRRGMLSMPEQIVMLETDLPAAIELVEEMARLLDLAGYVYKADTQWDRDRRAVLAKVRKAT